MKAARCPQSGLAPLCACFYAKVVHSSSQIAKTEKVMDRNRTLFFVLIVGMILFACNAGNGERGSGEEKSIPDKSKYPKAVENDKIFRENGEKYLYGGSDSSQHFNISNFALKEENLHFGIGREHFPALIDPEFISVKEMDQHPEVSDTSRFLLAEKGGDVKAYSLRDLTRHEVVNDTLDGEPVMAAYCHLADLGAVYDRNMYGKTFTFGLSGYTYYEEDVWDGMDGFVLWDRETESLWWPLTGKAVSGKMKGAELKVLDEKYWSQTDWRTIKKEHPGARVLKPGQDMEPPEDWRKYEDPLAGAGKDGKGKAVAPKWGENERR